MLLRNLNCLNVAFLLGAGAFIPGAFAQESATTNRPSPTTLSAALRSEEIIGSEAVKRAYVHSGTNEFAFVVPPGFRFDGSNPEKLVLVKNDYTCFINFRVVKPGPSEAGELKVEGLRQTLLSRYPGARVLEEFTQSAANQSGPAFDLQFRSAADVLQSARVVFIPSAAGVLEFTLVANADQFTDGREAFNTLLLTFCTNQGGKLEITPFSDKS